MKKIILLGSTGATGKYVLEELLKNESIEEIVLLNRRKKYSGQNRITEVIVDFDRLEDYQAHISGDAAISCLGTTLKAAGSKDNQWKVDVDYQFEFARLAKQNGIPHFSLVSSFGADPEGRFFYSKMKGVLEEKIQNLAFEKLSIFRPPSLIRPESDRAMEKMTVNFLLAVNKIGILKNYQPLKVSDLAKAIVQDLDSPQVGNRILEASDIRDLVS